MPDVGWAGHDEVILRIDLCFGHAVQTVVWSARVSIPATGKPLALTAFTKEAGTSSASFALTALYRWFRERLKAGRRLGGSNTPSRTLNLFGENDRWDHGG
jgi:hypothetical protein